MKTDIASDRLWEQILARQGGNVLYQERAALYLLYKRRGTFCQPQGAFHYKEHI